MAWWDGPGVVTVVKGMNRSKGTTENSSNPQRKLAEPVYQRDE